mmetsp:Transcript_24749/g.45358  ORF Transcript_24749/g.45358 Transcript_24749/m.45358 type:complete len:334 (+) Transcript_24749:100-1101(+)
MVQTIQTLAQLARGGPHEKNLLRPLAVLWEQPEGSSSAGETTGLPFFWASLTAWTVAWLLLFYILSYTASTWMAGLAQSRKVHENSPFWCGRTVLGILHAVVVSVIAVPGMFLFLGTDPYVQFAHSTDIADCQPDASDPRLAEWRVLGMMVAYAGLIFTAFILADVIVSLVHRLASWDYVLHHVVFLLAALIIRAHCILPLNSAMLLAMETSTPFLNFVMLLRHRPLESSWLAAAIQPAGLAFLIFYFIFRLVFGLWGIVLLWENRWRLDLPTVQLWFLLVSVATGFVLQLYWLPSIAKATISKLRKNNKGEGHPTEEDAHESSSPDDDATCA